MSLPREIASMPIDGARFPTAQQLGVPRPIAPDDDAIREIAEKLVAARNPYIIVSNSGRNPRTVPALVELCELLAIPVVNGIIRNRHCFPKNHPLYSGNNNSLKDADVVLVLETNVPWMPGPDAPPDDAYVAVIDVDPIRQHIPTFEFPANLRMASDSLRAIEALTEAAQRLSSAGDRSRIAERSARLNDAAQQRRAKLDAAALAKAKQTPIDPIFLSYTIGQTLGDDYLVVDDTLPQGNLDSYMRNARPGRWFACPSSSGGWATGAALGAKLAAPQENVVSISGDGFYMFSTANAAVWSAAHYGAPFMQIIYQNRSYSTGVTGVTSMYPESYAAKANFEGGYFDPPIDFAA
jgi:acetolactate synthase-1/2/3 large subunit